MPAPSKAALRDFESQWDACLRSILAPFASAPYTLQIAGHDTDEALVTPRLEFEFALNEPVGPESSNLVRPGTGEQAAFSGTITLRHVYDHTKLSAADAGAFRGAVRALLDPTTRAINDENLEYLLIAAMTEVAAVRTRYKDEKEKFLSEWLTTWAVSWTIRDNAWPV